MREEKQVEKLVRMVGKLEPQEFIGLCKILGIKIYDLKEDKEEEGKQNVEVRPAEILLQEVIGKIGELNRVQRRNLKRLLKPATRGR